MRYLWSMESRYSLSNPPPPPQIPIHTKPFSLSAQSPRVDTSPQRNPPPRVDPPPKVEPPSRLVPPPRVIPTPAPPTPQSQPTSHCTIYWVNPSQPVAQFTRSHQANTACVTPSQESRRAYPRELISLWDMLVLNEDASKLLEYRQLRNHPKHNKTWDQFFTNKRGAPLTRRRNMTGLRCPAHRRHRYLIYCRLQKHPPWSTQIDHLHLRGLHS